MTLGQPPVWRPCVQKKSAQPRVLRRQLDPCCRLESSGNRQTQLQPEFRSGQLAGVMAKLFKFHNKTDEKGIAIIVRPRQAQHPINVQRLQHLLGHLRADFISRSKYLQCQHLLDLVLLIVLVFGVLRQGVLFLFSPGCPRMQWTGG